MTMTRDTLMHLRFDEPDATLAPLDAKEHLADMQAVGTLPPIVDGFTGYARSFTEDYALTSTDTVAGTTLATRDCTVQAILRWNFDDAIALGWTTATVMHRGIGGSSANAMSVGVQLRVVNAGLRIAELRFVWQTVDGLTDRVQLGGHFVVPSATSSAWLLLTATRHWISSTEVELQYYVGAQLVGEHFSSDGDIGGGTGGATYVGVRNNAGSLGEWFVGDIDELRVLDYHVSAEEVEALWLRLSKWQPSGYTTVRQLMPPGAPISNAPSSRIQRLLKGIGHAIGYANAQIDNTRRNLMPDRAYGPVLEEWEQITGEAPRALDTTKQRRARVVSHFQQRQGVSPPGVRAAIADQVQLKAEQVELYAFSNDASENWASGAFDERVWWRPDTAGWSISGGAARLQIAAATDFRVTNRSLSPWRQCLQPLGGNARDAHIIAKLIPTSLGLNTEAGVCFVNWFEGNAIWLGMRNTGGVFQIVREQMVGGVLSGVTTIATVAAVDTYLHFFMQPQTDAQVGRIHLENYVNDFSISVTTTAPFTFQYATTLAGLAASSVSGECQARYQWAGLYARSTVAAPGALDVSFDDITIRARYGSRPFRWYAHRDPTLPGTPDLPSAQRTARRLAHAHTTGNVVASLSAKCDDPNTICDSTPLGGF